LVHPYSISKTNASFSQRWYGQEKRSENFGKRLAAAKLRSAGDFAGEVSDLWLAPVTAAA
jgi:hypothetical protein